MRCPGRSRPVWRSPSSIAKAETEATLPISGRLTYQRSAGMSYPIRSSSASIFFLKYIDERCGRNQSTDERSKARFFITRRRKSPPSVMMLRSRMRVSCFRAKSDRDSHSASGCCAQPTSCPSASFSPPAYMHVSTRSAYDVPSIHSMRKASRPSVGGSCPSNSAALPSDSIQRRNSFSKAKIGFSISWSISSASRSK